jgi:hypothetical protein
MGNVTVRFILSVAVAVFYISYVYHGLKTGRIRRYFGGWVTSNEAPFSFYSSLIVSAALAFLALYFAIKSGRMLVIK